MENWRERAKELDIPMYQRKKEDVIADIISVAVPEKVNLKIDVKTANAICRDALFKYAEEQGIENAVCEQYVERFIWQGKFLNCKRKGIIFNGTKRIS